MAITVAIRTMLGLEYQRVPPTLKVSSHRQEANIEKWILFGKRSVDRNVKPDHHVKLQFSCQQIQEDRAPPN
jgi:hypothetical protein